MFKWYLRIAQNRGRISAIWLDKALFQRCPPGGGSHGIKNNASKATLNCAYFIDIIILFQFINLTNLFLCAYTVGYVNPRTDAKYLD